MIAALRHRHRQLSVLLALSAPAVLLGGLLTRQPDPSMERLPFELRHSAEGFPSASVLVLEHPALWGPLPIITRLYRANGEASVVELEPRRDLRKPDILVYWMPEPQRIDDTSRPEFPASAELLGPLSGTTARRYGLPEPRGVLVLYSVGHGERFGNATLPWPEEAR